MSRQTTNKIKYFVRYVCPAPVIWGLDNRPLYSVPSGGKTRTTEIKTQAERDCRRLEPHLM